MKNFRKIVLFIVAMFITGAVVAQVSDKELKSKISKECMKEAKKLKKAGWEVMPDGVSIEQQIQDKHSVKLEKDVNGNNINFIATNEGKGESYLVAKKMASDKAFSELAEQIVTKVSSTVKSTVSGLNLGDSSLKFIDECISSSKLIVAEKIKGATVVIDIFRESKDGVYEVRVMYMMSSAEVSALAKEVCNEEFEKRSKDLIKNLKSIFG